MAGVADEAAYSLATKLPKCSNPSARDQASSLNLTCLIKLQSADSQPRSPSLQKIIRLSTLHEDFYCHYHHRVQSVTRTKLKTCKWRCSWIKSPAPAITEGINLKKMPSTASSFFRVATKEGSRSGLPKSSRPNPSGLVYCALSLLALFLVEIGSRGPENGIFQLPGSLLCNNLVVTCHLILGLPVFTL